MSGEISIKKNSAALRLWRLPDDLNLVPLDFRGSAGRRTEMWKN